MRFEEAMKALREGKKVCLKHEDFGLEINAEGRLIAENTFNNFKSEALLWECYDILSEDWEVCECN